MAMSSGGDEPVMDGETNSPFARSLVERMKGLSAAVSGEELFKQIKGDVTATTPQTPHYGAISSAGYDLGADYLKRWPTISDTILPATLDSILVAPVEQPAPFSRDAQRDTPGHAHIALVCLSSRDKITE